MSADAGRTDPLNLESRYNIPEPHPSDSAAAQEAAKISPEIGGLAGDLYREDLRNLTVFTCDPVDAKDFDDAISVEPRYEEGGESVSGYKLYVHVADVSAYVDQDSPIFAESLDRGVTFYLDVGRGKGVYDTRHMMPDEFASEVCSLVPQQERRAMTVEMNLDQDCDIEEYQIYRSVIESDARLNYPEANELLAGERDADAYEEQVVEQLTLFDEVTARMNEDRHDRSLLLNQAAPANRAIEEAMIAANRCAGHWLDQQSTGIFRVESTPPGGWVEEVEEELQDIGYDLPDQWLRQSGNPKERINSFIQEEMNPDDAEDVRLAVVTKLPPATYSTYPDNHFGIGYDAYAHFTSPIRRFGDLVNHLIINGEFDGDHEELNQLTQQFNDQSREAKYVERELKRDYPD